MPFAPGFMGTDSFWEIPANTAKQAAAHCALILLDAAGDTLLDFASDQVSSLFGKLFPNSDPKMNPYLAQFANQVKLGFSSRANAAIQSAGREVIAKATAPLEAHVEKSQEAIRKIKSDTEARRLQETALATDYRTRGGYNDVTGEYNISLSEAQRWAKATMTQQNNNLNNLSNRITQNANNQITTVTDQLNAGNHDAGAYTAGVGATQTGASTVDVAQRTGNTSNVTLQGSDVILKLIAGQGNFSPPVNQSTGA